MKDRQRSKIGEYCVVRKDSKDNLPITGLGRSKIRDVSMSVQIYYVGTKT